MTPIDISDSLARLAPDLPRVAVVFADLGMGPGFCLGMTGPSLWKELGLEPGPAMLLNRVALEAAAEEYLPVAGSLEEARRHEFLATAVHELGHIACLPPPYYDFGPSLGSLPQLVRLLERLPAAPPHVSGDDWSLDAMHGASWIRLTLHLRARAQRLGLYLSAANVAWHPAYGSPDCFRFALGDEPELMADWPIEQIKLAPPPAAFLDLFHRKDVDMPTATCDEPRIAASRTSDSEISTGTPVPVDSRLSRLDLERIERRRELQRIIAAGDAAEKRRQKRQLPPLDRLEDEKLIAAAEAAREEWDMTTSRKIRNELAKVHEAIAQHKRFIAERQNAVKLAEQNFDSSLTRGKNKPHDRRGRDFTDAEKALDRSEKYRYELSQAKHQLKAAEQRLDELTEAAAQPESIDLRFG
jgi:hypothetical protein